MGARYNAHVKEMTGPLGQMFPNKKTIKLSPSLLGDRSRVDGSWRLFTDVPNKPGWIAQGNITDWLVFPVSFGPNPKLSITYLRSYEKLGEAEVILDGIKSGYRLHGL